jgi:hypothetical protein
MIQGQRLKPDPISLKSERAKHLLPLLNQRPASYRSAAYGIAALPPKPITGARGRKISGVVTVRSRTIASGLVTRNGERDGGRN